MKKEVISAKKLAQTMNISYKTALRWLQARIVPETELKESAERGQWWEIPERSIRKIHRPRMGPKSKKS